MNRLQEILINMKRNTTYTLINALGSYISRPLSAKLNEALTTSPLRSRRKVTLQKLLEKSRWNRLNDNVNILSDELSIEMLVKSPQGSACFDSSFSTNRTSLSTGRSRTADFTLTLTLRTKPFLSGKTC